MIFHLVLELQEFGSGSHFPTNQPLKKQAFHSWSKHHVAQFVFTSDECLFMLVYFCKCKFFGLRVLLQRLFLQQQQTPLENSSWLLPITVFSLRCPDAGSRMSPSLILPQIDGQPASISRWLLPIFEGSSDTSVSPFVEVPPGIYSLGELMETGCKSTWVASLSTLGCSRTGPRTCVLHDPWPDH